MNVNDERLPLDLRALLADVDHPPPGDDLRACIVRGERAFDAVTACLGDHDPLLAEIAEILWTRYSALELHEQMELQLQRMLAVLDRPGVAPCHRLGMAFKRLSALRMQQERWDEAGTCCERGIAAFAGAGLAESVEAGKVQYMLGVVHMRRGRDAQAQDALQSSLPVLRQHPEGREQLIRALRLLAKIAQNNDDPGDALPHLVESVRVLSETIADSPKTMLESVFEVDLEVGRCLLDLKQAADAERHMLSLIAMLQKLRPANRSLFPTALDYLAEAYLIAGEHRKARQTYERALRVAKTVHGPKAVELAPFYTHLMWGHMALQEHQPAMQAARKAVACYERKAIDSTRDSSYLDALWDLAERCLDAKRFDEADQIAQRLYALVESVVGPAAPRVGQIFGLRGRIRFERGDFEEALPLLERALELLNIPGAPAEANLVLARMAAEIRLFHRPMDEQAGPALDRVIGALQNATREVEEENDRIRHGIGLTPRSERS